MNIKDLRDPLSLNTEHIASPKIVHLKSDTFQFYRSRGLCVKETGLQISSPIKILCKPNNKYVQAHLVQHPVLAVTNQVPVGESTSGTWVQQAISSS